MRLPPPLYSALTACLLSSAAGCAHAEPTRLAASPRPTCPAPASAEQDGCAGSNPQATTRHGDFFEGYAAQSRQHRYRTRPPWNVAAVDYPVGYHTPLNQLVDIRKSQPKGCALKDWQGSQALVCTGPGPLKISGYRFDLDGGTWLLIEGARVTSITIDNSYFLNGRATDRRNGALVYVAGGNADLTVTNSTFDIDGRTQTKGMNYAIADTRSASAKDVFRYNAFFRMTEKGLGTGTCGDTFVQYNYFEELELGFGHGEFIIDGVTSCTKDNFVVTYNTALQTAGLARIAPGGGVAALLFLSAGNPKRSWNTIVASHNTLVANNRDGPGDATTSRLITSGGGPVHSLLEYSDNYMDPTGALFCYYLPSPTPARMVMKGNRNLLDGSSIDDFSGPGCHGHHS